MDKKYTIKNTSDEGVYYLVNGWNEHKAIWLSEKELINHPEYVQDCFFSKLSHAEASLTKLLKAMPEYLLDKFEPVAF